MTPTPTNRIHRSEVRWLVSLLILLGCVIALTPVSAAEVIPQKPTSYFNDYAGVISPAKASELNRTLQDFERSTSSQIVVAIFPRMQSGSSIEDYTRRIAESWRVGQKDKNNGAALFVFIQDRKLRIEVGYGLEAVIPDAVAKRIIENQIKPHFKRGDYAGGLDAGISAMLRAARGEYKGTGRTIADNKKILIVAAVALAGGLLLLALVASFVGRVRRATVFHRTGRSTWIDWGGGSGWGSGWGSWTGGSGSGGGDGGGFSTGGFSGGGGSFGGGGASGSW